MADFTLDSMAALLMRAASTIDTAEKRALEKAALIIETESKRVIGTYDYGWPELADATQAAREQAGFPANKPLLLTGEMRDSIGHVVGDKEASVGSNEDKAVWQELGTSKGIPPRSFLAQAAIHKEAEVIQEIGQAVYLHLLAPP